MAKNSGCPSPSRATWLAESNGLSYHKNSELRSLILRVGGSTTLTGADKSASNIQQLEWLKFIGFGGKSRVKSLRTCDLKRTG